MGSIRWSLKRFFQVLSLAAVLTGLILPAVAMAQVAETQQPAAEPAAAPALAAGDSNIGRTLFTGEKRFTNGGPPCISCHSAGEGALDGGILGPNLTQVFAGPKMALLNTGWVNSPGLPVMGPVFSARNITEQEMEHLRAFFSSIATKQPVPSKTGTFVGISAGGFVSILIFFSIVWSGRYRKRNKDTAHDALWRNYGGKGGKK